MSINWVQKQIRNKIHFLHFQDDLLLSMGCRLLCDGVKLTWKISCKRYCTMALRHHHLFPWCLWTVASWKSRHDSYGTLVMTRQHPQMQSWVRLAFPRFNSSFYSSPLSLPSIHHAQRLYEEQEASSFSFGLAAKSGQCLWSWVNDMSVELLGLLYSWYSLVGSFASTFDILPSNIKAQLIIAGWLNRLFFI